MESGSKISLHILKILGLICIVSWYCFPMISWLIITVCASFAGMVLIVEAVRCKRIGRWMDRFIDKWLGIDDDEDGNY